DARDVSFRAARVLARKGAAAVPALVEALKSDKLGARRAAADGLTHMGPECAPAGPALVVALGDPDLRVRWDAAIAVRKARPEARDAVPALIRMFEQETDCPQESAARTLASYGAEARSAIPALVKALKALEKTFKECKRKYPDPAVGSFPWIGTDWGNWVPVVGALAGIGPDEETARMLFDLEQPDDWVLEMAVFKALAGHPDLALAYMRAHPGVMAAAYDEADFLAGLVRRREGEYAELIRAVVDHENFPVEAMVRLGDRAFIPRIRELMKKADAHWLTYLEASLRALGEPADRIVRISESRKGDFRPASAWPGVDERRTDQESGGSCSGRTEAIITGRILMPDGAPATEPKFHDLNDRALLGMRVKEPAEITYDPKTGRFVYITTLFAHICPGKHREPGPYQTGSALVLIEADGARPLRAQFFDEMPEVEITLSRAE
ncbi:MAG: HEAT repeat domain-containing protein, partial [Planctomycetota bacterium]